MPVAALFALGVVLVQPAVEIEGDSRCPSLAEVRTRVAEVLPVRSDQSDRSGNVLRVEETSRGLLLDLRTREGRVVGQRLLARTSSCADLAAAAAVVVGIWQSDAQPEFGPSIDGAVIDLRSSRLPRERERTYDLGVAGLWSMAVAGNQTLAAPGLSLSTSMTFGRPGESARWGLRATASGTAEQVQPLAAGEVHWRRFAGGIGPQLRLSPVSNRVPGVDSSKSAWGWHLDLNADVRAAHLRVRGAGFATNRPSTSYEPAFGAGARLMLHRGKAAAFVELSAVRWLREQVAVATGSAATEAELPRTEAVLALGVAFCGCR
jgi:hypothetical protein